MGKKKQNPFILHTIVDKIFTPKCAAAPKIRPNFEVSFFLQEECCSFGGNLEKTIFYIYT